MELAEVQQGDLSLFLPLQGPRAEAMMRSAMERGKWVFFQNCHLAPSFMPALERLVENIDPDKVCIGKLISFSKVSSRDRPNRGRAQWK